MPKVLPLPFKILFVYVEPLLTLAGAYSAFSSPEWYLAGLIPGPTVSGLLHTKETNMAIQLYGVLLTLLALISLAIFPVIAEKSDAFSFLIARRLLFVLACKLHVMFTLTSQSRRWFTYLLRGIEYRREGFEGRRKME